MLFRSLQTLSDTYRSRVVLAGDFNSDILPLSVWLRDNMNLSSIVVNHLKNTYNTENRVRYRNFEEKYGINV